MIDTHTHLDREEAPAILARARDAGVSRAIVIATTLEGARDALAIADANDGVYASLGIHPHNADTTPPDELEKLSELLHHPRAVAVGETGLDYFRAYATPAAQHALFEGQIALAREHAKPLVIHTRAADDDTLAALGGFDGTVILHCFSSPPLLISALERGWYVSFAGNVTYNNADELREVAREVPADRLLAETDSPYLAPQPKRGETNEPAFVMHTLAVLAEARGVEPAELEAQIDQNATAAFGL